jgi:thiol-disulfide isomerase/thioredoxin
MPYPNWEVVRQILQLQGKLPGVIYKVTSDPDKELDEFNFHRVISETPGLSLVFFSGPHCASCHHLRDLLREEAIQFDKHFSGFTAFEVKADKAAALVNEFNVFHLPTLFLYQDGVFHCELQTEAHPRKIIEAIELALKKPPEEEP